MDRRHATIGIGAGAIAMLAGAGVAWYRRRAVNGVAPGAVEAWWSQRFQRLDSTEPLVTNALLGQPLLLNFWAPWCVPCVVELPLLAAFAQVQAARGWRVLALAIDAETPVRSFVAEHGIALPVALAGAEGLMLARSLGNQAGGLPYSVVFDASGEVRHTKLGSLDQDLLTAWSTASA